MTLYTDAFIIPILHARKAGFFPPQTHVGKLGNELALPGRKKEACVAAKKSLVLFCNSRKQLRQ